MGNKNYKSLAMVFLATVMLAWPFAAEAVRGAVGVGRAGVGVGGVGVGAGVGGPGVGVDRGYVGVAPGVGAPGAPVARAAANGRYYYNGRYYNYYYKGAYYNSCQTVPGHWVNGVWVASGMVCR